MNSKMRSLMSKLGLITLVTMMGTTPLMAQEAEVELFNKWAQLDLHKAENYGILEGEWILDGMTNIIDQTTFDGLSKNISIKLGQIPGATLKDEEIIIDTSTDGITKKEVLDMLYTILMSYDYSKELNPDNKDVVAYMTELGVIRGDGKELGLDMPCTEEVAAVMSRRLIEEVYDIFDADSKGLFWKVEHNGNTVYMLGAIHFGTASMHPMSDEIENAYDESNALVVEANIYLPMPEEAGQYQYYMDGTTIKDHVSEEYYNKLVQVLAKYNLTPDNFGPAKEWVYTNNIAVLGMTDTSSSNDPALKNVLGVDKFWSMYNLVENKKPQIELEGAMYQLELLDNMGAELKELQFEQVVDNALLGVSPSEEELSADAQAFIRWNNYWNTGNADALAAELMAEEESEQESEIPDVEIDEELLALVTEQAEEYNKALWETRDTNMTDDIETMLNGEGSTTYFVTVGAGHYVSDTGIIKQLQDRGYTVTQIK